MGRPLRVVRRQRHPGAAASAGLLVVDTHASAVAAREVVDDIRRLGAGEVVAVVNTHEHFDHTFGNGELRAAYGAVPIHAHETAAERTVPAGERIKRRCAAEQADSPMIRARPRCWPPTIVPADRTFSSAVTWTSVTGWSSWCIPGAATPGATWSCGCRTPTCCWPATSSRSPQIRARRTRVRRRLLPPGVAAHPRHRARSHHRGLGRRAGSRRSRRPRLRRGAAQRRSASSPRRSATWPPAACRSARRSTPREWPFPREDLADAVRRGYEQLPRSQKRLPLI